MIGWHHQLDGREFEQALGNGEGQGSLACCILWGCKELDTKTEAEQKQQITPYNRVLPKRTFIDIQNE